MVKRRSAISASRNADAVAAPITDPAQVAAIAESIAEHEVMAFDIEFVSADRFIPELSLIQVGWGDPDHPSLAIIDCVALDPAPIWALVASPDVATVVHAGRQDLGILAVRHHVAANALWDTQIAAAFAGLGDQIGFAKLVERVLGVKLDKGMQFTAWLERPLSPSQLRYALDDVRYLLPLWTELKQRLVASGRLDWVREESIRLTESVGPLPAEDDAYRDVKGWRGLSGQALGSLRALAAWRLREALDRNKPLSWIMPDRAMIEVCQAGARSDRELFAVRGVGEGTVRRYGRAILRHVARGARNPPPRPESVSRRALSRRAQLWAAVIVNVIQSRCIASGIAPRFVATRHDAETLVDWFDRVGMADSDRMSDRPATSPGQNSEPDVALLRGWRRELAGESVLAWLRGQSVIRATDDPAGIELVGVPPRSFESE
ncbi:MAG: HRDC domain-containing protein [Proteobacteria bacterium]|nr:HRDC domain-containing protein [Pseudomonadota bacterium]